jgi:hypothetical protein
MTIVSKDGNIVFECEFDLERAALIRSFKADPCRFGKIYNLCNILRSPGHNNNVWSGGFQVGPANCVRSELGASWEVDLGCGGEVWRKCLHINACRRCSRKDIMRRIRPTRDDWEYRYYSPCSYCWRYQEARKHAAGKEDCARVRETTFQSVGTFSFKSPKRK